MTSESAIIRNDEIIFCSKEKDYPKFELAIFTSIFVKRLATAGPWIVHSLTLHSKEDESNERIFLLPQMQRDCEFIFCLLIKEMISEQRIASALNSFMKQVFYRYPSDVLIQPEFNFEAEFKAYCKYILKDIRRDMYTQAAVGTATPSDSHICSENQLLFAGISANGTPIVSHLYEQQSFLQFSDHNQKELLRTVLSGQLSTIAVNALFRAKCLVRSIRIKAQISDMSPTDSDMPHSDSQEIDKRSQNKFVFVYLDYTQFGPNDEFNFELLSVGQPFALKQTLTALRENIIYDPLFIDTFTGDLRKYSSIRKYITEFSNIF
jgi:hypothetical protein